MDAFLQEYNRLGRPLDNADMDPTQVMEYVAQHFSASMGGEGGGAGPPASTAVAPTPMPLADASATCQPQEYFFTVIQDETSQWHLQVFSSADGQYVNDLLLPDPPSGFYNVTFSAEQGFLLGMNRPDQVPVPCVDLMMSQDCSSVLNPTPAAPPQPLAPGVSPMSVPLPGMKSHGAGGFLRACFNPII